MENVLLVAYLLIVLAMIAVILVQRSEGGGLGMGGGSNSFMTTRGSANVLTRTTGILAALFFVLAIGLTVVKSIDQSSTSVLNSANQTVDSSATGTDTGGSAGNALASGSALDALNQLQAQTSADSSPATTTNSPATTPGASTDTTTPGFSTTPSADAPALAVPQTQDQTGGGTSK